MARFIHADFLINSRINRLNNGTNGFEVFCDINSKQKLYLSFILLFIVIIGYQLQAQTDTRMVSTTCSEFRYVSGDFYNEIVLSDTFFTNSADNNEIIGNRVLQNQYLLSNRQVRKIVFVDSDIDNYDILIKSICDKTLKSRTDFDQTYFFDYPFIVAGDMLIVILKESPVEEISNVLALYNNLSSIHILSHGNNGELIFGAKHISIKNLN